MTILEDTNAQLPDNAAPHAAALRLTRPTLDRQSPIRNWSTLFGPPLSGAAPSVTDGGAAASGARAMPGGAPGAMGQTLSDAVGQGYRVINDYLSQGQRYAQAMRWPDVASGLPGAPQNAAAQDPQQLLRRLMQYGWDFAGMWFEVWSRMGGPSGAWPAPPGAAGPMGFPGFPGFPGFGATPAADCAVPSPEPIRSSAPAEHQVPGVGPVASSVTAEPAAAGGPERFSVRIVSTRRVQSVLELRRGSWTTLLAHALRPEGHDAPAIRGVTIDAQQEQSTVRVSVEVPADQPPGVYNGMIIDAVSNLPRGTLTITVEPPPTE